jgi:hypothetical protein
MIPLKVCSRINKVVIGLTTWMKKCVTFSSNLNQVCQYEGKCHGILLVEGMCRCSSTAVGYRNNVEHVGPR